MTIYEQIKSKLEDSLDFRERRFRDKYLVDMVLEKNGKYGMFVDTNFLPDFAKDYMSYERIWRQCLQENKDLRGSDWSDGKRLAQEEQISLGYSMGFDEDIKKLNQL